MTDSYGNRLEVTAPAVADELAAAAELVTGKLGGRPISVVRGLAGRVLPAGEHGPGARALLRPRAEDMFALGAREAVLAAVRGRDPDCFGTPATTEEVHRAMESCGLAAEVDGVSVRVRLPRSDERSVTRDQVVAVERVRLVAHAHGWRPHSDSATPDDQGDYVTVSPTAP
jgi:coenzyme F420-0:L-glutamate ligase/coenzyme F420-1:gamma-L-glutamate ligase